MQPIPRKPFMKCPRCHSPAVHVPWEPARSRRRQRAFQGLALLWITSIAWVILGLLSGGFLWIVALSLYASATVVVGIMSYGSAHSYLCDACRLRWRL